jgi:lipoprotein NlpD
MHELSKTMRQALLVAMLAVAAGCTTSVVREISPASSAGVASVPKPGISVVVQRGDTLYGIAFRNGVDFRDLAAWNGIPAPFTIYPGQRLRLHPAGSGTASTSPSTAPRPGTSARPPATRPATPTPTTPAPTPAPTTPASSGFAWRWPADGQVIGRFVAGDATKQGIDIGGTSGQAVRAASNGVVVYSGAGLVGYGELIIIKHSEAWLSAYGHNRRRMVNEGQNVKAGEQIAEMGRSGASRDMLHFEIRYNGKPVDPLQYLPPK